MDWLARATEQIGKEFPPVLACDPVNEPMIRHWCEAIGHHFDWSSPNEAPAAMLQVWTFPGPSRARPPGSASQDATSVQSIFAEAGYSGVVTVSSEQEYKRALRPGDELDCVSVLESIGEEKRTGLGPGRFLTYRFVVRDQSQEAVGSLRITNLVYRPAS